MDLYDLEKNFCAHTIMSNLQQQCKPEVSRLEVCGVKHATFYTKEAHRCELCENNDDPLEYWQVWNHGISRRGSRNTHRTPRVAATLEERKRNLARFPLRNLLSKYRVLDAISHLKPEVVNGCLDLIYAEPPARPLAENLASIYFNPPRPWLTIRGMISTFHADVLFGILDVLSDAIVCTDYVLLHTSSQPILTVSEQEVVSGITFECIRARRHVLSMLQQKFQAFVLRLDCQSSLTAKSVAGNEHLPSPDPGQVAYYSNKPLPPHPARNVSQVKNTQRVKESEESPKRESPFDIRQGYAALTNTKPAVAIAEKAIDTVVHSKECTASPYETRMLTVIQTVLLSVVLRFPIGLVLSFSPRVSAIAEETSHFQDTKSLLLASIVLEGVFVAARGRRLSSVGMGIRSWLLASHEWYSCLSGISGGIKLAISRLTQSTGLVMPRLEDGKVRVKWRCDCGQNMYDDLIEQRPGAASELEEMLNGNINQAPASGREQPSGADSSRWSSSTLQSMRGFLDRSQTAGQTKLPINPRAYDPRPKEGEESTTVIDCDPESRWLLVCAKGKERPTSLSQLDICSTSTDKELFENLKKAYLELKSRWSRWFSLRRVQSIRFVQVSLDRKKWRRADSLEQFELHRKDFVDIRKVPDMPPENKRDEYLYQPCDLIPPVGEHLMAHLFHHPEDANEGSITCLRAPKKRKAKLIVCPQQGTSVGWGIHLVEEWVVSRLWLLSLALFVLGSLVFGICWAVLRHDVQGAFGVAAYMVALIGLVVGTTQANLS